MFRYAIVRFAGLIATLVGAAFVLFLLLEPSRSGAPSFAVERFLASTVRMLGGDFGMSAAQSAPIGPMIADRLAVSLPLALLALIVAISLGGLAGFAGARRPGSMLDNGLAKLARVSIAIPHFWLGMVLALVFAGMLRWLPAGGFVPWHQNPAGALNSLMLPALALALPAAALVARASRRIFVGIEDAPSVFAARARGLTTRRAVQRHVAGLAILPLAGLVAAQFGGLLAATMVVENVFYLPGLGRLLFDAIAERDAALVRGVLMVLIATAALAHFLGDLIKARVDPRLWTKGAQ